MPPISTPLIHAQETVHAKYAIIDPQSRKTYWFNYNVDQPNQEVNLLKKLRPAKYKNQKIESMQAEKRAALGGLILVNSYDNTEAINCFC